MYKLNIKLIQTKMKNKIEIVIFDWAGTTIDYGCFAPLNVFIEIFREEGIEITVEEARRPMGLLKIDHIKALLEMPRINDLWEKKFNKKWDEKDINKLYSNFEKKLFENLEKYTDPIPGVLDLIKRLREKNIKIGSTTGYTREMMNIVMPAAKNKGYEPDYCITATETVKGRPFPNMIFENIKELEGSSVKNVVKVGDTISDLKEGLNSGVWTIGVIKGSSELGFNEEEIKNISLEELELKMKKVREKMLQNGAHFVIDEIGKLDEVIKEIEENIL